jgi:hypothetical protein
MSCHDAKFAPIRTDLHRFALILKRPLGANVAADVTRQGVALFFEILS